MEYTTVFEIRGIAATPEFPLMIYPIVGAIILVLGATSMLPNRWRKQSKSQRRRSWFMIFLGLVWLSTTPAVFNSLSRADDLYEQYSGGGYEIADGVVRVVREEPKGGHASDEVIEVDGKTFAFSYFSSTSAYKATVSNGGHLKNGVRARVYHVGGSIVRVDIAQDLAD